MAKTAKLKRRPESASIHSRAAKRATSPSIDLDKSLKRTRAPLDHDQSHTIPTRHGAGITKRKVKGRQMTRQKRIRQEKGLQRAEMVMDQLEKKYERSSKKGKGVKDRRVAWDEVNSKLRKVSGNDSKKSHNMAEESEWQDEGSIEGDVVKGVTALKVVDSPEHTRSLNWKSEPELEFEDEVL